MPKLTYTIAGEQKTVEVTDSCSIGRLPENTISLPDENGSSRRHCQILKIASGFELADLGSTNGTKVNGEKVKRHKLKDGDEIQIGDTRLRWSDGSGAAAAAAADDEVVLEGDVQLEEPAGAGATKGSPGGGTASSEQCFLVFAGGARDGERVPLEKKRITFGRNAKNTFVFADDMGISGYHCEVSREGGAYVLRDLGSTNGTLLDGEPVTEVALQHGNRVRVGAQRFVFVDPAISDFEKAMSAVDDLGSEWGLLRAEMDMSRVQQARRSQMVAIGTIVVLLAGVGYVAVAHPEVFSGGVKAPALIPGNQIDDFSLERGSGSWAALAGSPTSPRYGTAADGAAAPPGAGFYVVAREGAAGRAAAAALGEKELIPVKPGQAYAFGAKVRTRGSALAAVRVSWLALDNRTVLGENATDATSASDWTEVSGTVSSPPRDAARARVELVNSGGDAACFDDVFFKQSDSAGPANEVRGSDVVVSITPDGQATLRRGSTTLLGDAAVVGGAARWDAVEVARRTDRVGTRKGSTVSGGKVRGQAYDAGKSAWSDYDVTWSVEGDRYVGVAVAGLADDDALVASLPKEFVDEGLAVRTDSGQFFRMSEARAVEKVRSIAFGERNVFEATAGDGAPFRLVVLRGGDGWQIALGGAKSFTLRLDTDSKALKDRVESIEKQAKDARNSRRFGDAVKLFKEVSSRLPQGSPGAGEADAESGRLDAAGHAEADRIRAEVAAAVEFQDDAELAKLAARAELLAQQYGSHAAGVKGAESVAAIRAAQAKRKLVLDERAAAPMLVKGLDYKAREDFALARATLGGVASAYPGTESARKAREALDSIPAGK